jgi:hypothetical protein
LTGCHDDLNNVLKYLTEVQGFKEEECLILMDDGAHHLPTKKNIMTAFRLITEYSQPGDVVFVHYSGHGGQTRNKNHTETSGYDSTIIPVDYQTAGQIIDDDIFKTLVLPMKAGIHATVLMDSCHSGTVLDLPYKFVDGDRAMALDKSFNVESINKDVDAAVPWCDCFSALQVH